MADFDINDLLKILNLSWENRDCVLSIYSTVVETCRGLVPFHPMSRRANHNHELKLKRDANHIETSRQNLMRLIGLLESYDPKCEKFKNNYLAWEITRKKNVKCLNDIAKSMHNDHTICNIASVSSNSVAALGGIAVIGALIFPPAAPFIVPVVASGMVAAGAGGAASFATSVADFSLLKKHLSNAQKVCEEDKLNFELLGDWISHTEELEKALTDLIGLNVWIEMWDNLKDFNRVRGILSLLTPGFAETIKKCVHMACMTNSLFIDVKIGVAAAILTTVIAMILFHVQTQSVLQVCKLGLGVFRGVEALVKIGKLASAAGKSGSTLARLVPQTLGKRIAYKAVAGVGLAIDLTMIVLSSIELAKGEMSEEGKNILSLAEMLEDERKVMREVYESMACTNYVYCGDFVWYDILKK